MKSKAGKQFSKGSRGRNKKQNKRRKRAYGKLKK